MISEKDITLIVDNTSFEGIASFEKVMLELSDGTKEELDVHSLFYENDTLFCKVHGGESIASFTLSSSLFIADRLVEYDDAYYINLCGTSIFLKKK